MLQHLIIHFSLHYLPSGRLPEAKKLKENFKLFILRAVAVPYERSSLARSSRYSELTWKHGIFAIFFSVIHFVKCSHF